MITTNFMPKKNKGIDQLTRLYSGGSVCCLNFIIPDCKLKSFKNEYNLKTKT